jgi:hypothetical protein
MANNKTSETIIYDNIQGSGAKVVKPTTSLYSSFGRQRGYLRS